MAGFIDQLCIRRDLGTLECDLTEGRHGTLMRESAVQNAKPVCGGFRPRGDRTRVGKFDSSRLGNRSETGMDRTDISRADYGASRISVRSHTQARRRGTAGFGLAIW